MSRMKIPNLFRNSNVFTSSLLSQQPKSFILNSCQLCATSRLFELSHRRSFVSQTKNSKKDNTRRNNEDKEYTHFGYEKVKEDEKVDKGLILQLMMVNIIKNFIQDRNFCAVFFMCQSIVCILVTLFLFFHFTPVYSVFENVANSYDVMNDLMSVGTHRLWKNHFVNSLHLKPGMKILDMAGGTGLILLIKFQYKTKY